VSELFSLLGATAKRRTDLWALKQRFEELKPIVAKIAESMPRVSDLSIDKETVTLSIGEVDWTAGATYGASPVIDGPGAKLRREIES
jgi:hypothetical protein